MSPTMPIALLVQASPTGVQLIGTRDEVDAYREAMCEWCTQHGIDVDRVPMTSPIVRDEEQRTVTVEYLQPPSPRARGRDVHGPAQLVTVQLEAPPLPWPAIVRALYEDPA